MFMSPPSQIQIVNCKYKGGMLTVTVCTRYL